MKTHPNSPPARLDAIAAVRTAAAGVSCAQAALAAVLAQVDGRSGGEPTTGAALAALILARPDVARAHRDRVLGPVLAVGDRFQRAALLEVADVWLTAGSVADAAQRLHCHRNTVSTRLRALERATGLRVAGVSMVPRDVLALALAVETHRAFGGFGGFGGDSR